ncbi:MAG: hypothetical protein JW738_07480 [Actinobacteria bacterium]|nr:hypothetical protein [Actinomycetota bacterium]
MSKESKRFSFIAALIVCGILLVSGLCGCGGEKTDLSYNDSGSQPVVVYRTSQAIAPIYNPYAPQVIIYGDGAVIQKKGPYKYTKGRLGSGGVDKVLSDLDTEGFFGLKESYESKEPLEGGITETVTVNLTDREYEVSAADNAGPSGWDEIVGSITGLDVEGSEDYIPPGVVLYAKEEADPSGKEILTWPGDAGDLANATAEKGYDLEGDSAVTAWNAVSESFEKEDEIVWEGGGKYYSYVYCSPVFPGVGE